MAMRVFKCPFCGYKFRDDPEKRYQKGMVKPVRGEEKPQPPHARHRYTVDLTCLNCGQDFEVKVEV